MGHCKKNEEKASEQEHKKHRSALRALKNVKCTLFCYLLETFVTNDPPTKIRVYRVYFQMLLNNLRYDCTF